MLQVLRYFVGVCVVLAGSCSCHGAEPVAIPHVHSLYGSVDILHDPLAELSELPATSLNDRTVKIVQFTGRVQPAWRQILAERGLQVRGYIPENALLVVATEQDVQWLRTLHMVRAVIDEPRLWRVDPRLVEQSPHGARLSHRLGIRNLTVELADVGARAQVEALVRSVGGEVVRPSADGTLPDGRVLQVRMDVSMIGRLVAHPDVAAVEPFVALHVFNDASYGILQANVLHQSPMWDRGLRGEGQIVGVCDVGVFTNSCYFPSDKIVQYENVTPANTHDQTHGTHTAGSIAGDKNNNGVYDMDDGMAPAARLYVQDAGTTTTGELALPSDLGSLFTNPYAAGVRIHSDSWGGDSDTYSARERSLDAFVAAHRDFLVLLANGNDGNGDSSVGSPATAKNIISVGALDSSTSDDVAEFSSHGPTGDGRIKPTVVSPGVNIMSASSQEACGTVLLTGTSMATPITAGGAAMVRQYFTDGYYPSGEPTPANVMQPSAALVKATLMAGTDDMGGANTDGAFPANGQGFGRVHLENSLYFPGETDRLWIRDDQEGLEQGQSFATSLQFEAGDPVHIVLTWMDEPGTPGAAAELVNNLDLILTGPDGRVYYGNNLSAGASQAGGSADASNVEEMIYMPQATPGLYRLTVRATDVPMGPQPYAIAITADLGPTTQPGSSGDGVVFATATGSSSQSNVKADSGGCAQVGGDVMGLAVVAGACLQALRRRRR